jgi:hypothetical protein
LYLTPFFVYVLPVLTVLALGLLGTTRRLGFWGTVALSILLTPIGGFIAAQVSGPRRRRRRTN